MYKRSDTCLSQSLRVNGTMRSARTPSRGVRRRAVLADPDRSDLAEVYVRLYRSEVGCQSPLTMCMMLVCPQTRLMAEHQFGRGHGWLEAMMSVDRARDHLDRFRQDQFGDLKRTQAWLCSVFDQSRIPGGSVTHVDTLDDSTFFKVFPHFNFVVEDRVYHVKKLSTLALLLSVVPKT